MMGWPMLRQHIRTGAGWGQPVDYMNRANTHWSDSIRNSLVQHFKHVQNLLTSVMNFRAGTHL
jgi:hypothetical protein